MNLTEKQVKDYAALLKSEEKRLREIIPLLTPTQGKFCNIVMDVALNPHMTEKDIARRQECSVRTVRNAVQVIRAKALPFRISMSLKCRMLEKQFGGATTELGKMTFQALQAKFSTWKKTGKLL